jgi:hypothetical protein
MMIWTLRRVARNCVPWPDRKNTGLLDRVLYFLLDFSPVLEFLVHTCRLRYPATRPARDSRCIAIFE